MNRYPSCDSIPRRGRHGHEAPHLDDRGAFSRQIGCGAATLTDSADHMRCTSHTTLAGSDGAPSWRENAPPFAPTACDVHGDAAAIRVQKRFEAFVHDALGAHGPPITWIGDEAMFGFVDPATALEMLGRLLPACRSEPDIPLTRTGLNHGPVLRRSYDLFGSTVNHHGPHYRAGSAKAIVGDGGGGQYRDSIGHRCRSRRTSAAAIDCRPRSALFYRIGAGLSPTMDMPRLQDGRALRGIPQGRAYRTLVLSTRCAEAYQQSAGTYHGKSSASQFSKPRKRARRLRTAGPSPLHWWASHRAVAAEDATVPCDGAQQRLAPVAFVEEHARVRRHCFLSGQPASRTRYNGLQNWGPGVNRPIT
jgi:hypothetical protein